MLNLPLAPLWAKLLQIPRPYLYAGILFFATLGAYARELARPFDLLILLVASACSASSMRRFGFPVLPLIVGVILGPKLEEQLTTALKISQGDVSTLWSEPVAVVVYVVMGLLLLAMTANGVRRPASREEVPTDDDKELVER